MTAPVPRSRKKSRGRILVFAVILVVAAAAYVVYRNNAEVFSGKTRKPPVVDIREGGVATPVESRQPGPVVPQGRNRPVRDTIPSEPVTKGAVRVDSVAVSAPPKLRQSVVVPGIECAILDRTAVHVVLSLELFFEDESMRDEILAKREQLKVMVRKVLSTKRFDEIQVEPLRDELKTAMNRMLSNGVLTDIEFRAFRIQ